MLGSFVLSSHRGAGSSLILLFFVRCMQVWSVAYSPSGDKLVSGCDDGVLQVFEKAA